MANARHPHDELIRAWLDGETIQYLDSDHWWVDLEPAASVRKFAHWYSDGRYRRKPIVVRYRLALTRRPDLKMAIASSLQQADLLERSPQFDRWVGDWAEVVVE